MPGDEEGANEGALGLDIATDHLFLSSKNENAEGRSTNSVLTTRADWIAQTIIHQTTSHASKPQWRIISRGRHTAI